MIRFIDLFSGIGGFRQGLERANNNRYEEGGRTKVLQRYSTNSSIKRLEGTPQGYRCVWSCDNNKYANQIYTARFGEEGHYTGDVRGVDPSTIPDFDLLCAGFPCQAFSVAGKRKGFQDTRGTLFFEIQRIAEVKRPSLLLLENVKGLLNHDGGRTFTVILQSLDELGYWVEWQVLNSKHFGVPQNRERVFIIGHLRGRGGREIFPITEDGGLSIREKESQTVGALSGGGHSGGLHSDMTTIAILPEEEREKGNYLPRERILSDKGVARAVSTSESQHPYYEVQPLRFLNRNQKNFGDTAMTVDPTNSTGIKITDITERKPDALGRMMPIHRARKLSNNTRIRRLTPIECERLQGFPDNWTEGISDTQRYKCLGNAVTVNVIKFLREQIYDCWC